VDLGLTLDHLKWLLLSFLFVTFSVWFAYGIFPTQASRLTISFVVIGLTPLLYKMMADEEQVVAHKKKSFMQRYEGIFFNVLLMAIGLFLAFSLWNAALPANMQSSVFSLQQERVLEDRSFESLIALMFFSFLLSLVLGAGAILIIAWDISSLVVSSALGPAGFLVYLPQLFALFLAGLAGALLSFAVIHHEWKSHGFKLVLKDSFSLLGISFLPVLIFAI
jgi:hypothetical protein